MIKIDNEFYIDGSDPQYALVQRKFSKKHSDYIYTQIKYSTTIERCLEIVMQIKQKRLCQKDITLVEALNEMKRLNVEFRQLLSHIREVESL